ncbi:glycosyltransferase 87 family protein [Corynebacterium sp. CNJ-954]|uniref:glycosyltransferase 87 family protein n=1 Tax=Corynebacterium sp. CNJ-954 TaxID=1904962 RepID=UPI00096A8228|nr:glycosyltransferase 87 family protein [Corynebacterium sp. CNJ-954]
MTITDDVRRHRLSLLPVLFAAFATFSLLLAVRTTQEPHRVWAACGLVTYSAAAVVTGVSAGTRAGRRVEPTVLWSVVLGALVAPTGILTANGRGQLEVRVVAESARRLMDEGTPYTAAPADVGDYNPYSPMMALFGMPRAWWGDGMVTDPRLWCAVALLVCMVCARVLLGTPRTPGHRLLLVAVGSPLVALTVAGSGVDLPVTGAVILALAAAVSGRPVVAGVAVGVAVAMKWTALPVAAVVVIVLWRRHSRHSRHSRRTAGTSAVVAGGVAAVAAVCGTGGDLGGFVHHTIGFPLGHGAVPTLRGVPWWVGCCTVYRCCPGFLRGSRRCGGRVVEGTDRPTTGRHHGGVVYGGGIRRPVPACAVRPGGLLHPAASDRRCCVRISWSGTEPRPRTTGGGSGGGLSVRSGAADRASPRPPAGCVG